jgi:hypothetical protein
VWNRLALLGQQARIQNFWRDVFSLSHTRAPPALAYAQTIVRSTFHLA